MNIVTGGDSQEQRAYGDFLTHADRYVRTGEFLAVLRRSWAGEPYGFDGTHYRVEDGPTTVGSSVSADPPIYFGGASPAAKDVAARFADVYLLWANRARPLPSAWRGSGRRPGHRGANRDSARECT